MLQRAHSDWIHNVQCLVKQLKCSWSGGRNPIPFRIALEVTLPTLRLYKMRCCTWHDNDLFTEIRFWSFCELVPLSHLWYSINPK